MNTQLTFGEMTITFLDAFRSLSDGGRLFGPVPKVVWNRLFPANDLNQIPQVIDPILIQYKEENILIDTALETSKLSEKEMKHAGVSEETKLFDSLAEVDLNPTDITIIIQTHMHNDHAGGLTVLENGQLKSAFPNATIYVNDIEWEDVKHPSKRTRRTYLKENWEPIEHQVKTWHERFELNDEITLIHTGGHSRGHSIVLIKHGDEELIHMADLFPTNAHQNPLYVGGVDDYPMDSIAAKEKWMAYAYEHNCKFIFYHNPYYAMIQFDTEGKEIIDSLKRNKKPLIPFSDEYMM